MELFKENLLEHDKFDMFQVLKDFPKQIKEAVEIAKQASEAELPVSGKKFIILGIGGSAIGGDLLKMYLSNITNEIEIVVNRDYSIKTTIDKNTNIIASSYSGETEETLTALDFAAKFTNNIICISSGGKLEEIAVKNNYLHIKIPNGMMPRCALGYSFFPMLYIILNSGLLSDEAKKIITDDIFATEELIAGKSVLYSDYHSKDNQAVKIADYLCDTIPVFYSTSNLDAVALRWKCQIQENAKNLSFSNVLPEMNHNEINSFSYPADLVSRIAIVLLQDETDFIKTHSRFEALRNILGKQVCAVININSTSSSYLGRIFDLIYLGDWASYYLALLNGIDPTPIPVIMQLKNFLAKVV